MATQNKKDAAQRRAELAAKQAAMARAERRRKTGWGVGIGVLVAALVGGLIVFAISRNNTDNAAAQASESAGAQVGESNLLAPTWGGLKGQNIDGVSSNQMEQLAYHIHAHLAIYINGDQKTVPYGIGIEQPWTMDPNSGSTEFVDAGAAFYYLHTHDDTGVIHIESPTNVVTAPVFEPIWVLDRVWFHSAKNWPRVYSTFVGDSMWITPVSSCVWR
jgi:hypothetical protein